MLRSLTLLVFAIFVLAHPAASQNSTQDPAVPTTTGSIDVLDEVLRAQLTPMPLKRVEVEAEGWMSLLVRTNSKLSENKVAELTNSGDATQLATERVALLAEQTKIVKRLNLAIIALKERGGDAKRFEQYLSASTGFDLADAWSLMKVATDWLVAEDGGIRLGLNLIKFLITLLVFKVVSMVIAGVARKAVNRMRRSSDLLREFVVSVARRGTFFIGLIVALSMLNVDITPFVAALGAAGLVIGFALQGTLSNFASGLMILIYRPYDIGETVSAAGIMGKVNAMTLVSTTLRLPDNQTVIIPNNSIWAGVITNVTGQKTRRVDLKFGVGYSDDLKKTQELLMEIVKSHPKVLAEPEPNVRVHELGESSVNFIVRPWVDTADYWDVFWDITRTVKDRFDEEGISIPFPQRDVHVHQVSD